MRHGRAKDLKQALFRRQPESLISSFPYLIFIEKFLCVYVFLFQRIKARGAQTGNTKREEWRKETRGEDYTNTR